jgi:hypothetical protein
MVLQDTTFSLGLKTLEQILVSSLRKKAVLSHKLRWLKLKGFAVRFTTTRLDDLRRAVTAYVKVLLTVDADQQHQMIDTILKNWPAAVRA